MIVEVSIARDNAGIGFLLILGLNLTRNSAARCCASAAEPPLPHSKIFPPDKIELVIRSTLLVNNFLKELEFNFFVTAKDSLNFLFKKLFIL